MTTPPNDQPDTLSLCKDCYCMTKTIEGKCGKCGTDKAEDQTDMGELRHLLQLIFFPSPLLAPPLDADAQAVLNKAVAAISAHIQEEYVSKGDVVEAEIREVGLAAGMIQMEMVPLMMHRLEDGFPSMTKEIIEKTWAKLDSYIKPWYEKVQAQKEKKQE